MAGKRLLTGNWLIADSTWLWKSVKLVLHAMSVMQMSDAQKICSNTYPYQC